MKTKRRMPKASAVQNYKLRLALQLTMEVKLEMFPASVVTAQTILLNEACDALQMFELATRP